MKTIRFKAAAAASIAAALMLAGCGSDDGGAAAERKDGVAHVDIAVLEAPSLTSFYAPIIDGKKLDIKNGLDITFTPKSTIALRTEVANGSADVSAGATVLTDVALLNQKGADTRYLFNVYDWWGTVVTPAGSDIQDLSDLENQKIVGALSTTNYAMFKITAGLAGVDLTSFKESSAEPSGLVAAAKSGREDAVQLWEPAHSVLTNGNEDFRALDLVDSMRKATGIERIPYVGMAAQREWLESNRDLVDPMYKTFAAAADFIRENPDEAAELIAKGTNLPLTAVAALLNAPDRLALDVYPASEATDELSALLDAAVKFGVLKSKPNMEDLIFDEEINQ